MEEDSSDEDDVSPPGDIHKSKDSKPRDTNMQPPPLPPTPGNVVVKKGYDPKQHGKYIYNYQCRLFQYVDVLNILYWYVLYCVFLQRLKLLVLLRRMST